jgi:hypothetical protein
MNIARRFKKYIKTTRHVYFIDERKFVKEIKKLCKNLLKYGI